MNQAIHLSSNLKLPVDIGTETIAVLGRRGSGKSNTATALMEELITAGQQVYAVAGASLAASGRVAGLPGSPTGGTNYEVVGRALTPAAATAGAELVVRWERYTYQG